MARSLDDLINFLLAEIAFCGQRGATPEIVLQFIDEFYAQAVSISGDRGEKSKETTMPKKPVVDRLFKEKVWKWLMVHPDVCVGRNKTGNKLSLPQIESQFSGQAKSGSGHEGEGRQEAPEELRTFVTEQRMWLVIAGHAPDLTRIHHTEFELLAVIASYKGKGIIQSDLVSLSGQDKRSVPKRTDALQRKGYIEKRAIHAQGSRTSLCTLRSFVGTAPPRGTHKTPSKVVNDAQTSDDRVIDFDVFLKDLFDCLKELKLITRDDLKRRLGMNDAWRWRLLSKTIRKLEMIGCVKRVKAASEYSNILKRFHSCVKLVREPDEKDLRAFHQSSTNLVLPSGNGADGDLDEDGDEGVDDVREGIPHVETESTGRIVGQVNLQEVARALPQWNPDRNLPNLLFHIVEMTGTHGISNLDIRLHGFGRFYQRPLEHMMNRLVGFWQYSQPPHLRHLAIIRDTALTKTIAHFIHYSYENFRSLVESGQSSWDAVEMVDKRIKRKDKEAATSEIVPQTDEYGFALISQPRLQFMGGEASLVECLEAAKPNSFLITLHDPQAVEFVDGTYGRPRKYPEGAHEHRRNQKKRGREDKEPAEVSWTSKRKASDADLDLSAEIHPEPVPGCTGQRQKRSAKRQIKKPKRFEEDLRQTTSHEVRVPGETVEQGAEQTSDGLVRDHSGVYVGSRGTRRQARGRPRVSRVAIFKSPRLLEYSWFTSESSPALTVSRNASSTQRHAAAKMSFETSPLQGPATGEAWSLPLSSGAAISAPRPQFNHSKAAAPMDTQTKNLALQSSDVETLPRSGLPSASAAESILTPHQSAGVSSSATTGNKKRRVSLPDVASLEKSGPGRGTFPNDSFVVESPIAPNKKRRMGDLTVSHDYNTSFEDSTRKSLEARGVNTAPMLDAIEDARFTSPLIETQVAAPSTRHWTMTAEVSRSTLHALGAMPIGALNGDDSESTFEEVPMYKSACGDGPTRDAAGNLRNPESRQTREDAVMTENRKDFSPIQIERRSSNQPWQEDRGTKQRGHSGEFLALDTQERRESSVDQNPHFEGVQEEEILADPEVLRSETVAQEKRRAIRSGINVWGGSIAVLRRKIVMEIVERCGGVFPFGLELWYAFCTAWRKAGESGKPDVRTVRAAVKSLIDTAKLRQLKFSFKDHKGVMVTRGIITKIDIPPNALIVKELQKKVIAVDPQLHIPPGIDVDSWLMKSSTTVTGRQRTFPEVDPDAEVRLQQKPAVIRNMEEKREQPSRPKKRRTTERLLDNRPDNLIENSQRRRRASKRTERTVGDFPHDLIGSQRAEKDEASRTSVEKVVRLQRIARPSPLRPYLAELPQISQGGLRSVQRRQRGQLAALVPPARNSAPLELPVEEIVRDRGTLPVQKAQFHGWSTFTTTPSTQTSRTNSSKSQNPAGASPILPKLQRLISISAIWPYAMLMCPKQTFHSKTGTFSTSVPTLVKVPPTNQASGSPTSRSSKTFPTSLEAILGSDTRRKKVDFSKDKDPAWSQFQWTVDGVSKWEIKNEPAFDIRLKSLEYINHSLLDRFEPAPLERPIRFENEERHKEDKMSKELRKSVEIQRKAKESTSAAGSRLYRYDVRSPIFQTVPPEHRAPVEVVSQTEMPQPSSPEISVVKRRKRRVKGAKPQTRRLTTLQHSQDQVASQLSDRDRYPRPAVPGQKVKRVRGPQMLKNMPEAVVHKIATAVVVIRTLAGGLDTFIDWTLVAPLFPDYSTKFLKGRWRTILTKNRLHIDRMQNDFRERFVEAYKQGLVPSLNYEDLENYDWEWIVGWAQEQIEMPMSQNLPSLPAHGDHFDQVLKVQEESPLSLDDTYQYNAWITVPRKQHLIASIPFSAAPPRHPPHHIEDSSLSTAKTWVRANVVAAEESYQPFKAREKLEIFGEGVVNAALKSLISEKVLATVNKGRLVPGRNYDITDTFLNALGKKRLLEALHLRRAAQYKLDILDIEFNERGFCDFNYQAEDGDMLALINMTAEGRVTVRPRDPPKDRYGLTDSGYLTRFMDKDKLNFAIEIRPVTGKYVYGNPLCPNNGSQPPSLAPAYPRGDMDATTTDEKIPVWFDIHGNFVKIMWDTVLAAIIGIVAVRPGIDAGGVATMVKPNLGAWEVDLVLEWVKSVGVAERVRGEGSGGGWRCREWWWLVVGE